MNNKVAMAMRAFRRCGPAHGGKFRRRSAVTAVGTQHYLCQRTYVTCRTTPLEQDFTLTKHIGQGSFADVFEAVCHKTGVSYACKAVEKAKNPLWRKEVELCKLAAQTSKATSINQIRHVYDTNGKAFIISDLCSGGDLLDWLVNQCPVSRKVHLTELRALQLMRNMLAAAESCHRAGLAHLDIKPENFVFRTADPRADLVLIDFGSAEAFSLAPYAEDTASYKSDMDDSIDEVELRRIIGTAKYMSPEVFEGRFSSRSDVWSLGVIFYVMLSNQLPFSIEEEDTLFKDPLHLVQPFLKEQMSECTWAETSNASKDIVCWMLNPDPGVRASTTESLRAVNMLINRLESLGLKRLSEQPRKKWSAVRGEQIFAPLEPRISQAQFV